MEGEIFIVSCVLWMGNVDLERQEKDKLDTKLLHLGGKDSENASLLPTCATANRCQSSPPVPFGLQHSKSQPPKYLNWIQMGLAGKGCFTISGVSGRV